MVRPSSFSHTIVYYVQAGARAGMVAPDDVTFEYLKGRTMAPKV